MIRFSVIIPNFNHAPFLAERIDSVLNQTYQHFEVIILDDHSADNSKEIIENYRQHPKVSHIVYAAKNSGSPFGQWQKGIELAQYEWIWIAESDDVAMPRFLEAAAGNLSQEENAGLWYCNSTVRVPGRPDTTTAAICNELFQTNTWNESYTQSGADELNNTFRFRSPVLNVSAVVFRRDVFKEKAPDLSAFRYYGDWYTYISLCPGISVVYNKEVYNIYRRTDSSHSQLMDTRSKLQVKEECFRILLCLHRSSLVTDKKGLLRWFVEKYVGLGFKTDGLRLTGKLVVKYYSINFRLATKVLVKALLIKLMPRSK
ncbi:MAG: glycosyltransferase family 2 protein [Chitinophagaceae bacterium]|nr:glycosyltransferase family 2 protein [Chitinophagaceae bacterium]